MIKNQIKEIEQYSRTTREKLVRYNCLMKDLKKLIDRDTCPCCNQKLTYDVNDDVLNDLKSIIDKIWIKRELEIKKEKTILAKKQEEEDKINKILKAKINDYLKNNRNRLNKAIRDYYNPKISQYLPIINSIDEKQLWNAAMEIQLDRRDIEENYDLYFQ